MPSKESFKTSAAACILFAAAVLYRLTLGLAGDHGGFFSNFSPLAAIALCGGIYLPKRLAMALPLAVLFVTDLVLNAHYHAPLADFEMISRYAALGLAVSLGWALRGRAHFAGILGACVASSTAFYLITNTTSWLDDAGYARTFSGWAQALTTGLPGYAPTWMFFRSSLISDLLFTALFVFCMAASGAPARARGDVKTVAA